MRVVTYEAAGRRRVGVLDGDTVLDAGFDGDMVAFIAAGAPVGSTEVVPDAVLKAPLRPHALLDFLVPEYVAEGKSYLSIGIGCTGGRHRSVVLGEELGRMIEGLGYQTRVHHRDVGRG